MHFGVLGSARCDEIVHNGREHSARKVFLGKQRKEDVVQNGLGTGSAVERIGKVRTLGVREIIT
jgi:hypothetical protein